MPSSRWYKERNSPSSPQASETQGWLEKIKEWTSKNADVKARFDAIKQAAEQATEHIIKLMVIFLLQTLVMPLLLLWALYGVARGVFEMPSPTIHVGVNADGAHPARAHAYAGGRAQGGASGCAARRVTAWTLSYTPW